MTNKTLRVLLDEAESALGIYKNPDLSELRPILNEVLTAAGFGSPGNDLIWRISESSYSENKYFQIETEYYIRNCLMRDTFYLPSFIVDSPDPIVAAKKHRKETAITKAQQDIAKAEQDLIDANDRLLSAYRLP